MTRFGFTGHQVLPHGVSEYVRGELVAAFANVSDELVGYSSLAAGADQLCARTLLTAGGRLRGVVPSLNYESTFDEVGLAEYRALLSECSEVVTLDFASPTEKAFDAAGLYIAQNCELMIAIWDGQPARGLGGTADAVAHAQALGRDVKVIWPENVRR